MTPLLSQAVGAVQGTRCTPRRNSACRAPRCAPHLLCMSIPASLLQPPRLVAVLGPTNTGKTHLAVERMLGHASGMIGLPLRLLAREIYDRIVKIAWPPERRRADHWAKRRSSRSHAQYFVCTVEAMPLDREGRVSRGRRDSALRRPRARPSSSPIAFSTLAGRSETMLMGAATVANAHPPPAALEAEFQFRGTPFSSLTHTTARRSSRRLPRRSGRRRLFSADAVYAIAELIRRHRGGAAVVMGSL